MHFEEDNSSQGRRQGHACKAVHLTLKRTRPQLVFLCSGELAYAKQLRILPAASLLSSASASACQTDTTQSCFQVISAPDLAPAGGAQAALAPNDMRTLVAKHKGNKAAAAVAATPADGLQAIQVNRKYGGDSLGWAPRVMLTYDNPLSLHNK